MSEKARVLAVNAAFYKAIREGDYAAMERLWAEGRTVTCTHPDWRMLVGRDAVMESWRAILTEHEPPLVWPAEAQAIVTGRTAMVICTERIGGRIGLEMMASNSFVREGRGWRLMNHQSAYSPAESMQ